MSELIKPEHVTVDGVPVRYAQSETGRHDAILLSPWPESIFAFEPVWTRLASHAHLVAVDPPGFGGSEYREELMNPKAMGDFVVRIADALDLREPHIVAPDIGTSSSLFAAASAPGRFRSIIVGSGGAAVPLQVAGVLKEWIELTDLEPLRQLGGRKIVEIALGTITGFTPSEEAHEDYLSCYEGDRFARTVPYAQSYLEYLPQLAELLPSINIPVRVVQGSEDDVVPAVNAEFLAARLPHSRVDLISGAGHFCWEERPDEYAQLVTSWWAGA